jgi:hypothetical protein
MIHLDFEEAVLFEVRRGPVHTLITMAAIVVLAIIPLVLYGAMPQTITRFFVIDGDSTLFFAFLYSTWLLILWTAFYFWWIEHYSHAWIVTDSRIFDLTQSEHGDHISYRLEDIRNVQVPEWGGISRIGNIVLEIETADGLPHQSMLHGIPWPHKVRDQILEISQKKRDRGATVVFGPEPL